jgi:transcriptional regulator with XRE-family HTH domain
MMFIDGETMSRKPAATTLVPTLVAERLRVWGMCVRKQRITQRIRASDLCARMGISHPTLQRLQRGEASVSAGVYLEALHILGIFDECAPLPGNDLWQMDSPNGRARPTSGVDDDDYF